MSQKNIGEICIHLMETMLIKNPHAVLNPTHDKVKISANCMLKKKNSSCLLGLKCKFLQKLTIQQFKCFEVKVQVFNSHTDKLLA